MVSPASSSTSSSVWFSCRDAASSVTSVDRFTPKDSSDDDLVVMERYLQVLKLDALAEERSFPQQDQEPRGSLENRPTNPSVLDPRFTSHVPFITSQRGDILNHQAKRRISDQGSYPSRA